MDKKQGISWGVSFGSIALVAGMVSYLGLSNSNNNQAAVSQNAPRLIKIQISKLKIILILVVVKGLVMPIRIQISALMMTKHHSLIKITEILFNKTKINLRTAANLSGIMAALIQRQVEPESIVKTDSTMESVILVEGKGNLPLKA